MGTPFSRISRVRLCCSSPPCREYQLGSGGTGVAVRGVTHSIAGMFGADMGLTSLAF